LEGDWSSLATKLGWETFRGTVMTVRVELC
jgi:hypothetical protein